MKPEKVKSPGITRSYQRKAYALLDSHMARFYKMFAAMEDRIRKSGIRLTYHVYLCAMFLTTGIAALASLGTVLALGLILRLSLVGLILFPLLVGIAAGAFAFIIQYFLPRLKANNRKRRLDEDLAFVVGRMAVLAASGMTPETVIRNIAEDDSNDLIIKEFRKIVRDMTLLGMDLTHALQEARRRSASDAFAAFLDGMISTSNSGADINSYLLKQSSSLMNDKRLKTKQFAETLGVIAEMYTTLLVVMPLILIILFAVMGVIVGTLGGLSINLLIELVVYVMVPFGGIMIMVLADGAMPRR